MLVNRTSAHPPAYRTMYRVPTLDHLLPLNSYPQPLHLHPSPTRRSSDLSAAPVRTFSSALVSAEWRAQRENDRRNQFRLEADKAELQVGAPDIGPSLSE